MSPSIETQESNIPFIKTATGRRLGGDYGVLKELVREPVYSYEQRFFWSQGSGWEKETLGWE